MTRSRRKRKKNGHGFTLILLIVFVALAAFAFGGKMGDMSFGAKEYKDLNEWFEVSGEQVKIYLDGEPEQEMTALARGNAVYIPYEYVCGQLNNRFFWSAADQMISYSLPDETKDYTESDMIKDAPAFHVIEDRLYMSLDLIETFTNISDNRYTEETYDAKRVFLYHGGTELLETTASKKTVVKTKKDKKAPVLTEIEKGALVFVTERDDEWSRVITSDGILGFAKTKHLNKPDVMEIEDTYQEPAVQHTLLEEKVVMGWNGIYNKAGNTYVDQRIANTSGVINVISPTWIQISDAEGNYENYTDTSYISKAHENGLKVWVCVDNFNQPGGLKDFSTRDYFGSASGRRKFISRLMNDAAAYGYDGLNLDFEGLPSDAGESYIQFIRELSIECRKAGIVLSVDNYVPYGFNDFYNMEEQGIFADYVVVMLYDEHTDTVGSVASYDYTDFGITQSMNELSADRIIAGLPLYTRIWTVTDEGVKSETVDMTKAAAFVRENGISLKWDDAIGQHYGEMQDANGNTKMIWMEDAESLRKKMELVRKMDLGGIALWRLGYEPAEIWNELDYAGRKNGN